MKHRARGREIRREAREHAAALAAISRVGPVVVELMGGFVDAVVQAVSGWASLFADVFGSVGELTRDAFALVPGPPPTLQGMIDDVEGRELVERILERKRASQRLAA